jgi:hypothetical protein
MASSLLKYRAPAKRHARLRARATERRWNPRRGDDSAPPNAPI